MRPAMNAIAAITFLISSPLSELSTYAQLPPQTPLAYDVAAIKPTAIVDGHWRSSPTPDGYSADDVSLLALINDAYWMGDKAKVLGGPAWINSAKFDIEAKVDADRAPEFSQLTIRQRYELLQPLLADRFHLKVHHESRNWPIYALLVAKGRSKLRVATPEIIVDGKSETPRCPQRDNHDYTNCSMRDLALVLSSITRRLVIDQTGLKGRYDFNLNESLPSFDEDSDSPDSIFIAVRAQLGLRLKSTKAPTDVLVIDHAEKPSPN